MLNVTYLGHAGWTIQSEEHAVLVDPLLTEDFGRGPAGARMPTIWPPRIFSLEHWPRLEAVVISHEHEDHFNLPSLNLLERSTPVLISARATKSAFTVLREMGFSPRPFIPGEPVRFGSLELLALSPDHILTFNVEEWDGLGVFARDMIDGGSFFTPVDVRPTKDMLQRVVRAAESASHLLTFYYDHLAWLPIESVGGRLAAEPAESLNGLDADVQQLIEGKHLQIVPGATTTVSATSAQKYDHSSRFVRTPPVESWPERPMWRYHAENNGYSPASGKYSLSTGELDELSQGLEQFAQFLYGSLLYRRLYSVSAPLESPRKPKFVMLVLQGQERRQLAFEYEPRACAFQQVAAENPWEEYLCGVECWGTDLLALFRGTFEPRVLSLGHSRFWRPDKSFPDPFLHLIWPFFHPQRWPEECLTAYRAQLASLGKTNARVYYRETAAIMAS